MSRFTALLDACALVPIALADSLLRLAEAGIYRPLWSERILEEMADAVVEIHPDLEHIQRRVAAMRDAFDDATVTGWEPLVGSIDLPDPDDRHVVAAAIVGRADIIVTASIKDFPKNALAPFDIEAQTPDTFLLNQLDLDPRLVMRTIDEQAAACQQPSLTIPSLLTRLRASGAPGFSEAASHQLWRVEESNRPQESDQ